MTLLGFTLAAKLVSSKDLTQVHLKISKLAFTLDDRVCYLRHKLSIIFCRKFGHVHHKWTARKCNHEAIAKVKGVL